MPIIYIYINNKINLLCANKNKFKGRREKDWFDDYLLTRDSFSDREEVCVCEGVYDESGVYYTHSCAQLYTQVKFALKISSHNFQNSYLK